MQQHVSVGDQITLTIRRLGINGEGIGYFERLAIFVDGALPDENVSVEITEVFENRAIGLLKDIMKESKDRMIPFCPVYASCGGCQTQHLDYQKGLDIKRDMIVQTFLRYVDPKFQVKKIKQTIGAEHPLKYRNKASLPIQKIKDKNRFGMYRKNSNKFIEIESCPIQNDLINKILNDIVSLMDTLGIDGMHPKFDRGYVKNVVVRTDHAETEAQVSLILNEKSNRMDTFASELVLREPKIKSVVSFLQQKKQTTYFSDVMTLHYGKDTIETHLGGYTFDLKPEAFFQLNSPQAHLFYQTMVKLADLKGNEIAIDAYSGIAPVSHYIHNAVKLVYAIESDSAACASARLSLQKNGITNVKVLESDFNRALSGLKNKQVDIMFFDPPRTGLGEETIELIKGFRPKKIIYGSCNPSTLAKDLKSLLIDYELIETVPIDMFPYTSLIESVSLLRLKTT